MPHMAGSHVRPSDSARTRGVVGALSRWQPRRGGRVIGARRPRLRGWWCAVAARDRRGRRDRGASGTLGRASPMNIHGGADHGRSATGPWRSRPTSPAERRDGRRPGRWLARNPRVHPGYDLRGTSGRSLPAPHQVAAELWNTTCRAAPSPRSAAWSTTPGSRCRRRCSGFAIGTVLGILLAVGIVHNRAMDLSVMPWAIASQTIPILAIAPMIIVVLNSVGMHGAGAEGDHLGLSVVLPGRRRAW